MAGGPPSSIDIGDGTGGPPSSVFDGGGESSSTSSLTYYERKFGGGGDGSDFDPSAFEPSYTPTDKGERRQGSGMRGGTAVCVRERATEWQRVSLVQLG